jgi:phosphate/sulfate permease
VNDLLALAMLCVSFVGFTIAVGMFLLVRFVLHLNKKSEEIILMGRREYRWERWKRNKLEEYDRIENEASHQTNSML